MKPATLLFTLLAVALATQSFAQQAGDLDSTFGVGGIVTTVTAMDASSKAYSLSIQTDGKIVAVGYSNNDGIREFAVIRYNVNGIIDSSFGVDGKATTLIDSGDNVANSVIIQPNGKIIAIGFSGGYYDSDFAIVRYNTNGTLDTSFSADGKLTTAISNTSDVATSAVLQPDGKIIVAGHSINDLDPDYGADFSLVRYHTNGILDTSFGTNGKVTTDINGYDDRAFSVVIQPDGKIVVAGSSDGAQVRFAILRYNTKGILDDSFGINGVVITAIQENDFAFAASLQPDGKIIVAGSSESGYPINSDFALCRYNSNGTLDNSFSNDGKLVIDFDFTFDSAKSIAVMTDGKIIVVGSSWNVTTNGNLMDFALVQCNADGSIDNNFGEGGMKRTNFAMGMHDYANSVVLQSDGKIVVAGQSESKFALARYLSGLNVGILTFSPAENVVIYPNPIRSNETLEYSLQQDEVLSVSLYDMGGRLVHQFISNESRSKGNHKEALQFSEYLSSGNYLLTITNEKGSISVKVTKP